MAAEEEVGNLAVKVSMDSSGFQNGVAGINRQLKVIQSEFKASSAELGTFGDSTDQLKLKSDSLSQQIELQKQKVQSLQQAYQSSADKKGADASATQNLEIKLNNAKAALANMETELTKTNKEIDLQSSNWQKMSKGLDEIGSKMKSVGDGFSSVGGKLTKSVTAPLLAVGVAAGKVGMDYDSEMSRVKAISGATGDEFQKLNNQALQLGKDTAFSAKEAATGMENLSSAGFSVNETMEAMPGMLDLAASSGEDLASSSDIAASTLRGFQLEASQAGHVADVLAKNSAATNAAVADTGEAMKYVAPVAHSMGLSFEEVTAAIGEMANAGIKGSDAGTALRGSLVRLASPSKEAAGMMQEIGFNAFDAQGKMLPLNEIISRLQTSTSGLTDEQKQNAIATIFGTESLSGMLALIQAGPSQLNDLTVSLQNSDGAAKEMARTMQDNAKSSIEQMTGSLETAGIKLEQTLAPSIKAIADKIGSLADAFSNLSPETQKFILIGAGIIAALGPVLVVIGHLITAIGTIASVFSAASGAIAAAGGIMAVITGPIGITIGLVVALAAGAFLVIKNWTAIKEFFVNLWNDIVAIFNKVIAFIKNNWQALLLLMVNPFAGAFKLIYDNCEGFRSFVNNFLQNIKNALITAWNAIKTTTENVWNGIKTFFSTVWNGIVTAVMAILNPFIQGILAIWNSMKDGITKIMEGFKLYYTGIWDAIKTTVLGIVLLFCDLITGNFSKLKTDAEGIFNKLKDAFSEIWNGIKLVFTGVVEAIAGFLKTEWDAIKTIAEDTWNGIKTFFSELWDGIKETATSAWDNFKLWISDTWSNIVQGAKDIWNGLITWFQELPDKLYNLAVDMFTSMQNGVSSTVSNVKDAIVSGITEAIDWIKQLPNEALQWGKDIIQGITDGIKSAASAVGDAVNGVAQNIRSYLHFSVPDEGPLVDYESWMPDFMAGLAEGINKSKSVVTNAIKGLSTDISIGVNSVPATNTGVNLSSGFSGNITIPIYFDGKEIAEIVSTHQYDFQKVTSRGKGLKV